MTAMLAGEAAARDVQSRMHSLLYTAPVTKLDYLGGRFLAALVLALVIQLAVPIGFLLTLSFANVEPELVGPFRPTVYLGAYFGIAAISSFVATSVLFWMAAMTRRAMVSYIGGVLLLFTAVFSWAFIAGQLGKWELAKLLDPVGVTVVSEFSRSWTPTEKNIRSIGVGGGFLAYRLAWLGVAVIALTVTYLRFRLSHESAGRAPRSWWRRSGRANDTREPGGDPVFGTARHATTRAPHVDREFGFMTALQQALFIAGRSFRMIVTSWGGLVLVALTLLTMISGANLMETMGVPLYPTAERVTSYLGNSGDIDRFVLPLMVVLYAGELVWQEREARVSDIADAAPTPDWVPLAGKFLGLALVVVVFQALQMGAGMFLQASLGYPCSSRCCTRRFSSGCSSRTICSSRCSRCPCRSS